MKYEPRLIKKPATQYDEKGADLALDEFRDFFGWFGYDRAQLDRGCGSRT